MTNDEVLADDEIEQEFSVLTPQERDVLRYRFGLARPRRCTLTEISEVLAVSRQCVRRIENKAMRKLRTASS